MGKDKSDNDIIRQFLRSRIFLVKDGIASFKIETIHTIGETICLGIVF